MATQRSHRIATVDELAEALEPYCQANSPVFDNFAGEVSRSAVEAGEVDLAPAEESTFVGPPPTGNGADGADDEDVAPVETTFVGPPPDDGDDDEQEPVETTFVGRVPNRPAAVPGWLYDVRTLQRIAIGAGVIALAAFIAFLLSLGSGGGAPAVAPVAAKDASAARVADSGAPAATEGVIMLTTKPWAEVRINGQRIGRTPDVKMIWLTAGKHTLQLTNPKMQSYREVIDIVPGKRITRNVTLDAK
jgi:hypothetical protein